MAESTDKRAVWLLDVDGVVNLIGSKQTLWPGGQQRTAVAGWTIRWAPELVDFVNTVHRSGACEVRWATTWVDDNLIDRLAEALGFDFFETAYTSCRPNETHAEAKRRAACRVLDVGRRLVWTDDDAIPAKRRERIELLGDGEGDRWLTIAPSESYGLGPKEAADILAFLSAGSQDHPLADMQRELLSHG